MRTWTKIVVALATIGLIGCLVALIGFNNWRHSTNSSRIRKNLTFWEQSQEYQDYGMGINKPWNRNWTSSEPRSVYQDYDMDTNKPLEENPEDDKNTRKVLHGNLTSSEQSQEYSMDTNNTLYRMNTVREMMRHAWNNYKRYAWGKNELEIFTATIHTSFWFREGNLGATIVDGLDTLYLMDMMEEFREGKNWVKDHLHISKNDTILEVHKTITRYIGGLLSCYALTGDSLFKDKAVEVADALLPAFDTPAGLPFRFINPFTKRAKQYPDSRGLKSILSEVGALHLEFSYLSDVTGNTVYKQKVDAIRNVLSNTEKPGGLYPNFIYFRTGQLQRRETSLGEDGGPFYEYLLKAWLVSGKEDEQGREMFDTAMQVALDKLLRTSPSGLAYLVELRDGQIFEEKMDHFSCFSGAMFALASTTLENSMSARYMEVAENLTNTCHESYTRTKTKLGPKKITFSDTEEARRRIPIEGGVYADVFYMLWPETFQSYLILWRLTRKQQYRDWGWEAVEALEKHCRVEGGYSGLEDVYNEQSRHYDLQQTYFLSETLKYLYLLFADDSLLPLEDWVLNRAAHPLPVKGKNPLYRAAIIENEENKKTEDKDYNYDYNYGTTEAQDYYDETKDAKNYSYETTKVYDYNYKTIEAQDYYNETTDAKNYNYETTKVYDYNYKTIESQDYYDETTDAKNYNYETTKVYDYNYKTIEAQDYYDETTDAKNYNYETTKVYDYNYKTIESQDYYDETTDAKNYNYETTKVYDYNYKTIEAQDYNDETTDAKNYNYETTKVYDYNYKTSPRLLR